MKTQAIQLLEKLCTPFGIRASLSNEGNYNAVFARDAVMSGIAGLLAENQTIIDGLISSLYYFKATQGSNGQIASNFQFDSQQVTHVSFGTLSAKIDSCTYYLIGIGLLLQEGYLQAEDWKESVHKTIELLNSIEYNKRHLVYVPRGGNWADEYPYEGYLLYDQALRLWALRLCGNTFEEASWTAKANQIEETILGNYIIDPSYSTEGIKYHQVAYKRFSEKTTLPYYASGFSPIGYSTVFDLPANMLTTLVIKHEFNQRVFEWIDDVFTSKEAFPSVFYPIITPTDSNWEEIANFYLFVFKNKPHHYHNGGIWMIWLGWAALALAQNGEDARVKQLYERCLSYIQHNPDFCFDEYIDSLEMKVGGVKNLGYTATGIVFMDIAANHKERLQILRRETQYVI